MRLITLKLPVQDGKPIIPTGLPRAEAETLGRIRCAPGVTVLPVPCQLPEDWDRTEFEQFTVGEAAQLTGRSTKTILRWEGTGKLPCTRTARGHRRFLFRDLSKIIQTDDLLTTAQMAERLGISYKRVIYRAETGKLPCVVTPTGRRLFRP